VQGSVRNVRLLKEQNHKNHFIIINWRPDMSGRFFLHLHQLNKLIENGL